MGPTSIDLMRQGQRSRNLALRWFRSRGAWASGVGRGPGSGEGSVVVPPETEARFEPSFVLLYQIRPELAPAEIDLKAAALRYFPAVRWQGERLFTSCVRTKCALPAYIRFLRDTSKDEVPR